MLRIGNGYDIHRLVEGRPLILGGANIPYELGLMGHSDGDSLTHAVIDAVLGAAGLGDIGTFFPSEDPKYLDSNSLFLLKQAITMTEEKGFRIGNVDTIVICERPKLLPYFADMRSNLAKAMSIGMDQINIKAKTSEGLGFIGRSEAIAAYAIALLE